MKHEEEEEEERDRETEREEIISHAGYKVYTKLHNKKQMNT